MEIIIGVIFIGVFSTPYLLMVYDAITGSSVACATFGWHNGKGSAIGFDGCSATSSCSKCGKSVLQDSQGNWF